MIAEGIEKIALALEIILPSLAVDGYQLIDIGLGNFDSFAAQARRLRHIVYRSFSRLAVAFATLRDPTQDSQVFVKAWPQKSVALVALEPVDAEDLRWMGGLLGHWQPMVSVIGHVVAAERQHRYGIAPHRTHSAGGRRGGFRRQGRPKKSAMLPVEGLIDERNHFLPPRAEQHRADRHAFGLFPLRRIARALFDGHG